MTSNVTIAWDGQPQNTLSNPQGSGLRLPSVRQFGDGMRYLLQELCPVI